MTRQGVVCAPASADVIAERQHAYQADSGPLPFEVYRPREGAGPRAAVVFVTGFSDPQATTLFGSPLKDWASYRDWARMVASRGMLGITYLNRDPRDAVALVRHLRANADALGLDPTRIGAWACSGNAPNALALLAHERLACAALLYGYLLDLDGATHVRDAAAAFHFALPALSPDALARDVPLLIVRAGRDQTPGLNESLQRFVTAASARVPLQLVDHAEAPHAFDLLDGSARTCEVIDQVLTFLHRTLVR